MQERFAEMECCLLAGGKSNPEEDFILDGEITRLERGYRRYAKLFERVRLVLKKDQATERYLNYPHLCDDEEQSDYRVGIKTALKGADSEAVFIGSSDIADFPLELAVELVRRYNGELFLGYVPAEADSTAHQPLFGVYSKRLIAHLEESTQSEHEFLKLLKDKGKLLPLPAKARGHQILFG